jgi:organic hydroperoxide reductase OsmC/OhrA
MLLSSLGLCMLKTFEVFAARDGLDVLACRATVNGLVEQTPDGPNFTSIVVELDIDLAGDVAQVEGTLEDAKNYCIVHNALRVPIVVETQVRTPVTFAGNLAELPPQPRHEIVRGHQLRAM